MISFSRSKKCSLTKLDLDMKSYTSHKAHCGKSKTDYLTNLLSLKFPFPIHNSVYVVFDRFTGRFVFHSHRPKDCVFICSVFNRNSFFTPLRYFVLEYRLNNNNNNK